jgi:diacylglycerol kinase family enzyme
MNRRVCLIVNPTAGGGRAGRTTSTVAGALRAHGMDLRTVIAAQRQQVSELSSEAAGAGETVVTLGGDGMIGAAADGLREVPGSALGIIPAGRGNDLARVLGIPRDPLAACEIVAGGASYAFDLGEVNGRVFVGIASVGFDSEANRIANLAPSWLGSAVYAYGALRALAHWRRASFAVELVGEQGARGQAARIGEEPVAEPPTGHAQAATPASSSLRFTGYSVALANSRCFGGGMRLAPAAMLDDGLLDVVAIQQMTRARYLLNLPRVFFGAHLGLGTIRHTQVREAVISADRPFTMYADGDPIGELPVRVRVLPAAINVLAPTRVAAFGAGVAPGGAGAEQPMGGESQAEAPVAPGTPSLALPRVAPAPA